MNEDHNSDDLDSIILNLIKNDLTNFKLVNTLSSIGLDSDIYFLNLNESIFKLTGFDSNSREGEVTEWYNRCLERISTIDIPNDRDSAERNMLAAEILLGLKIRLPIINNASNSESH